jgi:hypothetical protein
MDKYNIAQLTTTAEYVSQLTKWMPSERFTILLFGSGTAIGLATAQVMSEAAAPSLTKSIVGAC